MKALIGLFVLFAVSHGSAHEKKVIEELVKSGQSPQLCGADTKEALSLDHPSRGLCDILCARHWFAGNIDGEFTRRDTLKPTNFVNALGATLGQVGNFDPKNLAPLNARLRGFLSERASKYKQDKDKLKALEAELETFDRNRPEPAAKFFALLDKVYALRRNVAAQKVPEALTGDHVGTAEVVNLVVAKASVPGQPRVLTFYLKIGTASFAIVIPEGASTLDRVDLPIPDRREFGLACDNVPSVVLKHEVKEGRPLESPVDPKDLIITDATLDVDPERPLVKEHYLREIRKRFPEWTEEQIEQKAEYIAESLPWYKAKNGFGNLELLSNAQRSETEKLLREGFAKRLPADSEFGQEVARFRASNPNSSPELSGFGLDFRGEEQFSSAVWVNPVSGRRWEVMRDANGDLRVWERPKNFNYNHRAFTEDNKLPLPPWANANDPNAILAPGLRLKSDGQSVEDPYYNK